MQDNRFHSVVVAEPHFGDIEGADHVRPTVVVSPLEGAVFGGAELAPDLGLSLLGLALTAEPGPGGHRDDTVAGLVHGHVAALAVAVDQRILVEASFVGTDTTAADHFFHFSSVAVNAIEGVTHTKDMSRSRTHSDAVIVKTTKEGPNLGFGQNTGWRSVAAKRHVSDILDA